MKITKKQLRELIKEFARKEFTPSDVKPAINIEDLLRPENTKMINVLKVEGDVTIKIGDNLMVRSI